MKEIKLSKGYVAMVDDEDFERVNQHKWFAHISRRRSDGSILNVYAEHNIRVEGGQKTYSMQRFILNITDQKTEVDHKDGNGLNNRRKNLRKATHEQYQHNAKLRQDNTTGVKGVNWNRGKLASRIQIGNKRIFLGYFDNLLDATKAYDKAAKKYHREFARINLKEDSCHLFPNN